MLGYEMTPIIQGGMFMFNVKFDFDERKFRQKVTDAARKTVEEKVRRIRCPEHHETARVHFTGMGDKLSWKVEGCCQRLVEEVKRALR